MTRMKPHKVRSKHYQRPLLPSSQEWDTYQEEFKHVMTTFRIQLETGLSYATIRYAIQEGYLVPYNIGRRMIFSRQNVSDWLRKRNQSYGTKLPEIQ